MRLIKAVMIDARLLSDGKSRTRVLNTIRHEDLASARVVVAHQNGRRATCPAECLRELHQSEKLEALPLAGNESEGKKLYRTLGMSQQYARLSTRIDSSKCALYLGWRSGAFLDTFTPPKGVACYRFHKLVLGTQCPYDCSYCYLQLTYRITPYPRIYLNLEKLFTELRTLSKTATKTVVLNAGELSDPLALDHIVNVVPEVIYEVLKYPNLELLLLTKSANVHHLPDLSGLPKRIIMAASLTSPRNQALFEHGTASIEDRINALRIAQAKGYRIRVRIDPIINSVPGWDDQYETGLIKRLANQVVPETVTLGQPRFYAPLLHLAKKRFPEQAEFWDHLDTQTRDHRIRASEDERLITYQRIIELLRDYFRPEQLTISLCKEDPGLARSLGVPFQKKCNCLPLKTKC